MKTFARFRTVAELKEFCARKGWEFSSQKHDEEGSDFVSFQFKVGRVSGRCLFSTVNGCIFGETTKGERFSSDSAKHDGLPWFDALLDAAYIGEQSTEKEAA